MKFKFKLKDLKKKDRKVITLFLILIAVGILLLAVNAICGNCFDGSWAKIFISLFTIVLAIIELGDLFEKKTHRKIALYVTVVILFLVGVWDIGSESIEYKRDARVRDSLIKVDSLRSAKIISDLNKNLTGLEKLSGQVLSSFKEVDSLKRGIKEQKPILNNILNNTVESKGKTNSLINDKQPSLTISKRYSTIKFDNEGNLSLEVRIGNSGFGYAKKIKVFYQVALAKPSPAGDYYSYFHLVGDKKSQTKTYPKEWTEFDGVLRPGVANHVINLTPNLHRKELVGTDGLWFLIYSTSCMDFADNEIKRTIVMAGHTNDQGHIDTKFGGLNLNDLKQFMEENYQMGEFIFVQ